MRSTTVGERAEDLGGRYREDGDQKRARKRIDPDSIVGTRRDKGLIQNRTTHGEIGESQITIPSDAPLNLK